MARPRKRRRSTSNSDPSVQNKRSKLGKASASHHLGIHHPVISHFYPQVENLRDYVIGKLPSSSRIRRKKVGAVGRFGKSPAVPLSDAEQALGNLLDTTFLGLPNPASSEEDHRQAEWRDFSQKGDESYVTLSNGVSGFVESQHLIVEFVIRSLFKREKSAKWPDHMLCDGFRRNGVLGLRSIRSNPYVEALQQTPWPELLALLGDSGDRIMIDLLLDCAVFLTIDAHTNNVCQVSGKPLSNVCSFGTKSIEVKSNSEVVFVRNRMFYARPALNARGQVQFGLRHIHVLNRAPYHQIDDVDGTSEPRPVHSTHQNEINTFRVMMYMFPRQFGLHNVFTSKVDFKETSQTFKDYTLREEEIAEKFGRLGDVGVKLKIPKRLRGRAIELVRALQVGHQRCSYSQLLHHYCPVHFPTSGPKDSKQDFDKVHNPIRNSQTTSKWKAHQTLRMIASLQLSGDSKIIDLATPQAEISAFCRAVLKRVVPQGFWGDSTAAENNQKQMLNTVDQFISLRRFENMALFKVIQGMQITNISWLAPPELMTSKTSLTDIQKRQELFEEFLYFIFDSLVIPLIRSNFYVTESNTDKYKVFFFRHDVWRTLVEPAIATLKDNMLEEVSMVEAQAVLQSRLLGFSQIRLLPKGMQMRPITNLRKRVPVRGNPKTLGPGINRLLAPAHTIFQLEKITNPQKMGSTMFSVGDIYKRIKNFKAKILPSPQRLYFAKVDVQSAFDTIPQAAVVGLLDSIPQQHRYRINKHLEVGTRFGVLGSTKDSNLKPTKKWPLVAIRNDDPATFIERVQNGQSGAKRNTVYVDLYQKTYETSEILQLVASHIQQNLVKIGKKYYRQKRGIPQGSILSSTLCNYFYADLETHVLPFLDSDDCLLLRLIDDFLLITTNKSKAAQFVNVLHHGVPEYGLTVNPKKTLVNFDLVLEDRRICEQPGDQDFPYCGVLIDPKTLDISRPGHQDGDNAIYNSLTVEFSRTPGKTFQCKVLNAFKIQSHLMFYDTELNSSITMLQNIYKAFTTTATKMWAYARCLPAPKQPPAQLIIRTISRLIDTAHLLLISKTRRLRYPGYVCDVQKCEVAWLAYQAFHKTLARRQSKYSATLSWLRIEVDKLAATKGVWCGRVRNVV